MSIVDTRRNDATHVDFVVEESLDYPVAPRATTSQVTATTQTAATVGDVHARETWSTRIARFLTALAHHNASGKNGFMLQDRAVYEEFRASAERQAMTSYS